MVRVEPGSPTIRVRRGNLVDAKHPGSRPLRLEPTRGLVEDSLDLVTGPYPRPVRIVAAPPGTPVAADRWDANRLRVGERALPM